MSQPSRDAALDALLADYAPPLMPSGLAARVAETATKLPQAAAPARPAPPRRDRRGKWLRRPFLIGGAAIGLAFSSAIAATYAGVELPAKVQAAFAYVPFVKHKAAEPAPARPARHARPRVETAAAPPSAMPAPWRPREWRRERLIQRFEAARERVATRRAAGLPTPRADRIERRIARYRAVRGNDLPTRAARRLRRRERIEALIEARRSGAGAPPQAERGQAGEQDLRSIRRMRWQRWRAMRQARMGRFEAGRDGNSTEPR